MMYILYKALCDLSTRNQGGERVLRLAFPWGNADSKRAMLEGERVAGFPFEFV